MGPDDVRVIAWRLINEARESGIGWETLACFVHTKDTYSRVAGYVTRDEERTFCGRVAVAIREEAEKHIRATVPVTILIWETEDAD